MQVSIAGLMSTVVASYTPMTTSRSPVLPSSSGTPASRSWRPAAAMAFPKSLAVKCCRPTSVIRALPEKQLPAFSIPPTALLYPVQPPDSKERWDIKEDDKQVRIWLQVPGLSEDDLEIIAGEDMLEIKRKASTRTGEPPVDVHGVGSFHVRLLMTKEYNSEDVTAELKAGMLEITIGKFENHGTKKTVRFGKNSTTKNTPTPAASSNDKPQGQGNGGTAINQK